MTRRLDNIIPLPYTRRAEQPESPIMFRVWRERQRIEELEADGWRELGWDEFVDLGGGNFMMLNGEGYYSGLFHGLAAGMLLAMTALAIVAALVAW